MDYDEAREAFFAPRDGEPQALGWTSPARRLRDAIEPLAAVSFWSKGTYDAYSALGLDFLGGYVFGRANGMGEPNGAVVAAAFGVFEHGLVADLYDNARQTCSLAQIRAAREAGTTASLHEILGDPASADGLDDVIATLREAIAAAPAVGRALFSGLASQPWPDDTWAQLWHACVLLREHRGDGHLAALVAADLDGLESNILTERWIGWAPLAYTGTRAWSPEAMAAATARLEARDLITGDTITDAGRTLRDDIERATDAAEQRVVDALGDRLDAVAPRLEGWSSQVIEQGSFPPDPYKRAAG